MYESIVEIDLHGKNRYQAGVAVDAALRRAGAATCRLRIIHGCNSGTFLRDFVQERYAAHPRVLRVVPGPNRGVTELVLREY